MKFQLQTLLNVDIKVDTFITPFEMTKLNSLGVTKLFNAIMQGVEMGYGTQSVEVDENTIIMHVSYWKGEGYHVTISDIN